VLWKILDLEENIESLFYTIYMNRDYGILLDISKDALFII